MDEINVTAPYDIKSYEEYLTIAYFELTKNKVETVNQRHWKAFFNTGDASADAPEYIRKAARVIERANMTQEERDMFDQLQKAKDIYETFYNSAASVYNQAIKAINSGSAELYNTFADRLKAVAENACEGWGFKDEMMDLYYDIHWLKEQTGEAAT